MTDKEKAKAYDEALEQAKKIKHDVQTIGCKMDADMLDLIFPELCESEDERIRKEIEFAIMQMPSARQDTKERCIAWLEKQKEQSIPWYDYKKSKEAGYTIVPNEEYERLIKQREQKPLEEYIKEICKPINDVATYLDEQLQRFKKEPSAEEYANILADEEVQGLSVGGEHIHAIKELIRRAFRFGVKWGKEKEQKPAEWSKDDAIRIEDLINLVEHHHDKEYDWFDYKDLSSWLKELPNRFELQPKQEWSEEDEKIRRNLMSLLANMRGDRITEETYQKYYPWLRDLRPSWKPSRTQMSMLLAVINEPDNASSESCHLVLVELYEELKEL